MSTDYYELLEVERNASGDEIKRAYRVVARKYHPDANPGDATAEARFKEISVAYEVLSDPSKREHYDRFGADGPRGGGGDPFAGFGGGGGLGDIFDAFFGGGGGGGGGRTGPASGPDLEVAVEIDFEGAVFGTTQEVSVRTAVPCEACEASGAKPGTHAARCDQCGGAGQVRQVRQSILGQMVTAVPCPVCRGAGEVIADPCDVCNGEGREVTDKTYTVDIPAGVDTGSTLRLSGFGAVGPRGGGRGDLYVQVRVRPHARFRREGDDLVHELHLPITQAALGAVIGFDTLDGAEDLVVSRGTQTGKVFRLRGRGVHHVRGRGRGDILVQVVVDTPTDLEPEVEEALRAMAAHRGDDVAPAEKGFLSRIKSAFS
ncbi:molecular chaperone DnaJ [Aquihabitans sp. G128]|uniref:molecular chaperone DnaJ n=1 Tax=Aquihabitans sp. G128 TaxID=2849779 RepID=UPI001C23F9C3|nr:molecular chaperone DnaJ [Aquihabitans sp. G128]QXC61552.1 molecular chaperone DnaJ [Aquihabitans sp. G128]